MKSAIIDYILTSIMNHSADVMNIFVNKKGSKEANNKTNLLFSPPSRNDFSRRGETKRFIANLILLYSCFMPYRNTAFLVASKMPCPSLLPVLKAKKSQTMEHGYF